MRKKIRIGAIALIGDRSHNSDYIRTALGKTLVRDMGFPINFTDEVRHLNGNTLAGCRLLIIFRDGAVWPNGYAETEYNSRGGVIPIVSDPPLVEQKRLKKPWMTSEQGKAVKDFVQSGGRALFMHNATYIAETNADFGDLLGAVTEGHPAVRPFKVEITNKDHPITKGVSDFLVTDEQHFMRYDKDPAYVFMRSINEDGLTHNNLGSSCEAGWAFNYGEGRVCYLAPGHNIAALWNPEYEKIQQNAVRWLVDED